MYPNGDSFFYSKIRNFTVVPNWPFSFLQWNAKFWKLYSSGHSFFTAKQEFYNCPQDTIHSLTTKYKILKGIPKLAFAFWQQIKKSKVASKLLFAFWPRNTKFSVIPKRPFVFLKSNKNRLLVLSPYFCYLSLFCYLSCSII